MNRNRLVLTIAVLLVVAAVALSQGTEMTPKSAEEQIAQLTEQMKVLNNRMALAEERIDALEKKHRPRLEPAL